MAADPIMNIGRNPRFECEPFSEAQRREWEEAGWGDRTAYRKENLIKVGSCMRQPMWRFPTLTEKINMDRYALLDRAAKADPIIADRERAE